MNSPEQKFELKASGNAKPDFIDIEAENLGDAPERKEAEVEVVDEDFEMPEMRTVESPYSREAEIDRVRKEILDAEIVSEDDTPFTPEEMERFKKKKEVIVDAKMAGGFSWGILGSVAGKAGKVVAAVGFSIASIFFDMWDSLMKSVSGPTDKAKG